MSVKKLIRQLKEKIKRNEKLPELRVEEVEDIKKLFSKVMSIREVLI